jgi:hypothetical protein
MRPRFDLDAGTSVTVAWDAARRGHNAIATILDHRAKISNPPMETTDLQNRNLPHMIHAAEEPVGGRVRALRGGRRAMSVRLLNEPFPAIGKVAGG